MSAGGCRNFPDTFHLNPQYRISLEDPDEEDDVDGCTIVIGLIQKERRKQKKVKILLYLNDFFRNVLFLNLTSRLKMEN